MPAIDKYGSPTRQQRAGNDSVYGSGVLGDITLSAGTTTLTSDMHYRNLTIPSGSFLHTNGFRVFVQNTLTLNGLIGVGTSANGITYTEPAVTSTGSVTGTSTSNAIVYRIGGKSGGATADGTTALPRSMLYSLDYATNGLFIDPADKTTKQLSGGAAGTQGSQGTTYPALTNADTWPGKTAPTDWPNRLGNPGNAGHGGSRCNFW